MSMGIYELNILGLPGTRDTSEFQIAVSPCHVFMSHLVSLPYTLFQTLLLWLEENQLKHLEVIIMRGRVD